MHERSIALLKTSGHPLDVWPWEGNFPPPLSARAQREFQRQVNAICGIAVNGKPNVRLMWPADPDPEVSMRVDYAGERRARYCLYSQDYECQRLTEAGLIAVETITVDIVPPRWMLEEYSEPSDSYLHLRTIAFHDARCCAGAESVQGQLCHGLYREPSRSDLDDLQRRVREREAFGERVYADRPLTGREMQSALSRLKAWREQWEAITKQKYKDAMIDGFMSQSPRLFSDDPTANAWGRRHFTNGHNKSGSSK
ncbi:MAG: hypothetical protein L0Y58_22370 [Verrucomicrobia subdivision 3 bacterium]|nr:hypothetical protein [Limisphaerales bacterium]